MAIKGTFFPGPTGKFRAEKVCPSIHLICLTSQSERKIFRSILPAHGFSHIINDLIYSSKLNDNNLLFVDVYKRAIIKEKSPS